MEEKSKFCHECGNPLQETDRFCEVCGTPVLNEGDDDIVNMQQPFLEEVRVSPDTYSKKNFISKKKSLICIVTLIIIIISVTIGLVWWKLGDGITEKKGSSNNSSDKSVTEKSNVVERENKLGVGTVSYEDLQYVESKVVQAHEEHVEAIYVNSSDQDEKGEKLKEVIKILGNTLHKFYIEEGKKDLKVAQEHMKDFLEGLQHKGFGLELQYIDWAVNNTIIP